MVVLADSFPWDEDILNGKRSLVCWVLLSYIWNPKSDKCQLAGPQQILAFWGQEGSNALWETRQTEDLNMTAVFYFFERKRFLRPNVSCPTCCLLLRA